MARIDLSVPRPMALIFGVCLLACLTADFFFTRAIIPNSDTIQNYNQLLAFRSGNFLLDHWALSNDNFYFTDLIFFVLLSFVFGTGTSLIFIVPFFIFCLFLLFCLMIVARFAGSRYQRYFGLFAVLFLVGLPFTTQACLLLQSAIHTGTLTLSVGAIWLIQPALCSRPQRLALLVPFSALIFAVSASDPMAESFLIVPLAAFMLIRIWSSGRVSRMDVTISGCLIFATVIGNSFPSFAVHTHGFQLVQAYTLDFVPTFQQFKRDISAAGVAMMRFYSASPATMLGITGSGAIALTRLIWMIVTGALILRVIWQSPRKRENGVAQFFVLGAIGLIGASVISNSFAAAVYEGPDFPGAASRYLTPVFVFTALAAILEAQALILRIPHRLRNPLAAATVCLVAPFLASAAQFAFKDAMSPPGIKIAPQAPLADWLIQRGFTYGVGDYWVSQMLVALSAGQLQSLPVLVSPIGLIPFVWNSDISMWKKMHPPQFVAFDDDPQFHITTADVVRSYGQPLQIDRVEQYTVMLFGEPSQASTGGRGLTSRGR